MFNAQLRSVGLWRSQSPLNWGRGSICGPKTANHKFG